MEGGFTIQLKIDLLGTQPIFFSGLPFVSVDASRLVLSLSHSIFNSCRTTREVTLIIS